MVFDLVLKIYLHGPTARNLPFTIFLLATGAYNFVQLFPT